MQAQKIFIYGVASLGNGLYHMEPFYADPSAAGYTNVNDRITDTNGKRFDITAIAAPPMADGGSITVRALDGTVPREDEDYLSTVETPNQVSLGSEVKTGGEIITSVLADAPSYKSKVSAVWTISAQALKARAGDSIVDVTGKEYLIDSIPGAITDEFFVVEKEKIGKTPALGACSLYRPTATLGAFQGSVITAEANQTIQNRDFQVLDRLAREAYETRTVINVAPLETPDGLRTVFTLPSGHTMEEGSLKVSVNGLTEEQFSETTENTFTLEMDWVPEVDDDVRLEYVRPQVFQPV